MRFQFQLSTLLFVVTALGIYIGVDRATAFTRYNDLAGRLAIYGLIACWLLLRRFRNPKISASK